MKGNEMEEVEREVEEEIAARYVYYRINAFFFQPGLGIRSRSGRVFLAHWSRSNLKKNQEPEPEPL